MKETQDRRPPALAGLLSLVLALIGTAVLSDQPEFVGDPATIATYYKTISTPSWPATRCTS